MFTKTRIATFILALALTPGLLTAAPFLSVDFDDASATETGFESFDETDLASKSFSGVTVTISGQDTVAGGFFDRGPKADNPPFDYGDLYRDFVFRNNGGTISFDISGLTANTSYSITWYIFDTATDATAGSNVVSRIEADGGSNTTGSTIDANYVVGAALTANDDYAFTGVWTSTDTSLEIDISFVSDDYGPNDLLRVNGFEISVAAQQIPAPAALSAGAAMLGLMAARRRRG